MADSHINYTASETGEVTAKGPPANELDLKRVVAHFINMTAEGEEGRMNISGFSDMGPEPIVPLQPPTHLPTDYIELACFTLVFLIGTPLNAYVFVQQVSEYRTLIRGKKYDLNAAFLLHKIHLNLANLLVLLLHCTVQIGWLITYRWVAGDFFCKFVHFVWMVAFILSSNIVATIAVDRLRNVMKLDKLQRGKGKVIGGIQVLIPVKRMLSAAWIITILFSLPQWWVFCSVTVMPNWDQCSTVWDKWRFQAMSKNQDIEQTYKMEKIYLVFHLLTVFWMPFVVISVSYLVIIGKLLRISCTSNVNSSVNARSGLSRSRPGNASNQGLSQSASEHKRVNLGNSVDKNEEPESFNLLPNLTSYQTRQQPAWRSAMRSKMFQTTALIVLAYTLLWMPYNGLSLVIFIDLNLAQKLSDQANWCKQLILLNVVLNPFLYGFGSIATLFSGIFGRCCACVRRV